MKTLKDLIGLKENRLKPQNFCDNIPFTDETKVCFYLFGKKCTALCLHGKKTPTPKPHHHCDAQRRQHCDLNCFAISGRSARSNSHFLNAYYGANTKTQITTHTYSKVRITNKHVFGSKLEYPGEHMHSQGQKAPHRKAPADSRKGLL